MVIKFRCSHCRQLLGIAGKRAGAVVDCPRCGRAQRVPELDGRVDPIPDPELDLEDSALVQALNQLSILGDGTIDVDKSDPAVDGPPEPVEVPLLPPPELVPFQPSAPAEPVAVSGRSGDERQGSPERPSEVPEVFGDLGDATAETVSAAGRRRVVPLLMLLVAAGAFAVGVGLAPLVRGLLGLNPQATPAVTGDAVPAEPVTDRAPPPAVEGRITYQAENGASRPDLGARVIVFPRERRGQVKLPIIGFRAGDDEADCATVTAAWRALGGDMAVVDEEGQFEVRLPEAGNYQVLVLSRYQGRQPIASLPTDLETMLKTYFLQPDQLLGQRQFRFDRLRYDGASTTNWEHAFRRE